MATQPRHNVVGRLARDAAHAGAHDDHRDDEPRRDAAARRVAREGEIEQEVRRGGGGLRPVAQSPPEPGQVINAKGEGKEGQCQKKMEIKENKEGSAQDNQAEL